MDGAFVLGACILFANYNYIIIITNYSGDNHAGSINTAAAIAGGVIVLFILILVLLGTIVWTLKIVKKKYGQPQYYETGIKLSAT